MQRTTTTLARSLRALTLMIALGAASSTSLAGPNGPNGYGRGHKTAGTSYQMCNQCDRRDQHTHARGGVLWIGQDRYELTDRKDALERLARRLRHVGYKVHRHGNELEISSRRRIGEVDFRNGEYRSVVMDRDRCSVTIRFIKRGWNRPRSNRGGWNRNTRWDRPVNWDRPSRNRYSNVNRSYRIDLCW